MTATELFVAKLLEAMDYQDMSVQRSIDRLCVEFPSNASGERGRVAAVSAFRSYTPVEFADSLLVRWGRHSQDLKIATGLDRDQWLDVVKGMSQ